MDQHPARTPKPAITKAQLTGSWHCLDHGEKKDGTKGSVDSITTYSDDNTFTGTGTVSIRPKGSSTDLLYTVDIRGTWKLEGRIVTDKTEVVTAKPLNIIAHRSLQKVQVELNKAFSKNISNMILYIDDDKVIFKNSRKKRSLCQKVKT
ncbi:hypothetical protein [Spongorhabdus nitratireducens]